MSKSRQLLLTSVIATAIALAGVVVTTSADRASAQGLVAVCELTDGGYNLIEVPENEVDATLEAGGVLPDEYGECPTSNPVVPPEPPNSPFVTFFRELLRNFFQFLASLFSALFGGMNAEFAQ